MLLQLCPIGADCVCCNQSLVTIVMMEGRRCRDEGVTLSEHLDLATQTHSSQPIRGQQCLRRTNERPEIMRRSSLSCDNEATLSHSDMGQSLIITTETIIRQPTIIGPAPAQMSYVASCHNLDQDICKTTKEMHLYLFFIYVNLRSLRQFFLSFSFTM